jgi:hypothetical protein
MRKFLAFVTASAFLLTTFASPALGASKAGTSCTKAGSKIVSAGKSYTCVKSGKKLVWDKGSLLSPATSPSPVAVEIPSVLPTSFENLYQNRTAIAYAAWSKTGETMKVSEARIPTVKTFIGPNTKPWYSEVEKTFALVSRAFPTAKLPANALVFYYNFTDVLWAEDKLKTLISDQTYTNLNRNEGGHLLDSNCQAQFKDCLGAKEVTTYDGLDIAILLIGVSKNPGMATVGGGTYGDPGTLENNTTGQLLAHEYFHALQREEQIGKNLSQTDWPPRWVTEGSAYFIQNAVINSGDFGKYSNWRKIAVGNYIKEKGITEEFVTDFMNLSHYSDNWSTFEGDWNYFLGSRIIETLVALKGPGSIIDFYKLMGQGKGFEYSFDNVFGIAYKDAVPIIAKTVADNWKTKS